ncbi:MAG: type II toxin-antitoxin system prevent-host-death family antitoxin [Thermoanaerobaculaceae bacterium]
MRSWQLQEAKAKLSEVVSLSQQEGPQEISVRGRPVAIVVAKAEFERLSGRRLRLVEMLRRSPLGKVDLDLRRDRSPAREVEL